MTINKRRTQITLVIFLAVLTLPVGFAHWSAQAARGAGRPPRTISVPAALVAVAPAPAVFITLPVTNTNDSGLGSFRQAILDSNASIGTPDVIEFRLGTGTPTINVLSQLPAITDPVTINGNTGGATRVELNGAATSVNGLVIQAGNTTIKGLVINRFVNGVVIATNGGNTVSNCYIGTDADGTTVRPNTLAGLRIQGVTNNTIGGATAADRNVISGNGGSGVAILNATATGNRVIGNYIGVNVAGTAALGNGLNGVEIQGGQNNTIERNVISANSGTGVVIVETTATGNKVIGNYIGTDASGTADLGNTLHGVAIGSAPNNTIGGTGAGERNVISGNNQHGVWLNGLSSSTAATGNKVIGNYIGTDVSGTADLGNSFEGVRVQGASGNTIGGANAGEGNVISGNNRWGLLIDGVAATGNKVIGNYIGTNAAGAADLGNTSHGVFISFAPNNTIGGTIAGERNVISGNDQSGILIQGAVASGNKVTGNTIGRNATDTADVSNSEGGVYVELAPNNTIGGPTAAEGNLISGNRGRGVFINNATATGNAILGNAIFNNTNLGIDLAGNGITANDAGDADAGPNNQQNFPVLNAIAAPGALSGTLDSAVANTAYPVRLEFFANAACDASGNGEGQSYLGFVALTAPGAFTFNFTNPSGLNFITATATDNAGNTSEFSPCRLAPTATASVSAASYTAPLARESIAAAYGVKLATGVQVAATNPLPTALLGTTVKLKDSLGVERSAPLFFVSPGQINYQVPPGTAAGAATITITGGDGALAVGSITISDVEAGLFSANANGQGLAAALVLRVAANGAQTYEPVTRFENGAAVGVPIDLGPANDQVFLILYGTGFRFNAGLSTVSCGIGGATADVLYAGAQGELIGLDQANVRLPRSLSGRGNVNVALTVNGKAANVVTINVK